MPATPKTITPTGGGVTCQLATDTGRVTSLNHDAIGDAFEITCEPGAFSAVKDALAAREIETLSAQIAMLPTTTVPVEGDKAKQVLGLMEAMEDHDDVQNVYANFDISEEVMAEVDAQSQ